MFLREWDPFFKSNLFKQLWVCEQGLPVVQRVWGAKTSMWSVGSEGYVSSGVLGYSMQMHNYLFFKLTSEKFYRPLNVSVVPVVYAAPSVHKVAPPHSYIDVRDFQITKTFSRLFTAPGQN